MLRQNPMVIICVLIGCIFLAGCISQTSTGNQTVITQTPETPPIIGPSEIPSAPTNETPYIIINPIDKHHKNETFEINGTTNLGADEKIYYNIHRPSQTKPVGAPEPNLDVTEGFATVVNSGGNLQHWSFRYNSSEYFGNANVFPVVNILTVSARNMTVMNYTDFPINSRV
jgi:hypothetical protein